MILTFSAKALQRSVLLIFGFCLSLQAINLIKNALSSGVYRFPFVAGTTILGGVGEREGVGGGFISALGGGRSSL